MLKCERCKKEFDENKAREKFEDETFRSYANLKKTLCADCAIEAIDAREDGVYTETCARCGREFDPFEAEAEFQVEHSWDLGASLNLFDEFLCVDCANRAYEELSSDEEFYDEKLDDRLSVYVAAELWVKHQRDESYMFGYTKEQLEEAL